ncbi:VCBS repeat-containing protein [Rhodohalobacter sulfatireducens]|uniref:VCBS repeat-containing protein n=1 Tax=Rhodohalobacter sulfatireducens TaxID=2911366 RepID=A0ABS9KD02_9BACT|nr:VCBS repeat-containing protein [Rhodohalobacter sulfatireducens]MCG2588731.1 VCBS repeat-containing protein [Rhodohalobacter sulfatireducens]
MENTPEFNIQNYLYFYDGGGVAAGDINNDGLTDLFFTGNSVADRLYLNKGDFEFEDITESAGFIHEPDSWSTGVTMADINGDNYLDIYVSRVNYLNKSGVNQLFINNGDSTFTERAEEFGLDFEGYSTQAAFFDYDNDGDLDMFLLNHSFHSENTYGEAAQLRQQQDPKAGDKLFRNDGDIFTDVTGQAGIISSALGYGLGVAVTDINRDGWMDIYVGNDFHEDDYLYINNGDGTFSESLYQIMGHTSSASMGNDTGDINNDGLTDLVSLDMMPNGHEEFMTSGGPDLVVVSDTKAEFGFGANNNRNTLQVNRGIRDDGLPRFSETAFASGVARTEWSWAALLADFNNSGFQDLFVTNGLPKRPNELDYVSALRRIRSQYSGEEQDDQTYALIERMSSVHVPNYMFKNQGDLTFKDVSVNWGFDEPTYSNGAVYTDLDNDGKLDLVTNNINSRASIFENKNSSADSTHYLKVTLGGENRNSSGIGAKLFAYHDEQVKYREQSPTRGFQSSVDHTLHFGLGEATELDSMVVIWPDRRYQTLRNIQADQTIEVLHSEASGQFDYQFFNQSKGTLLFENVTEEAGIDHRHRENVFNDFDREPLMPYKLSTLGPALAVADINEDGLDDYYFGGAKDFAGQLYVQQSDGSFQLLEVDDFRFDRASEDVDALFFDATGNGLKDLYVVSGGNEYTGASEELLDRLYINLGEGDFRKSTNSVPEIPVNSSSVTAADFDGDGHIDLFVAGHSVPWSYGVGPQNKLLLNNGKGVFSNVISQVAPDLEVIGNITAASWIQKPDGQLPDLIVAGEWMNPMYFENQGGQFNDLTEEKGLDGLNGLWQSIYVSDLNGNGLMDIVLGNFGTNSRLQASDESPLKLFVNDFNEDGQTAPIIAYNPDGEDRPFEQLDEILAQLPDVQEKIRSYRDYANKNLEQLFLPAKLDSALQKEVNGLRSVVLMNSVDEEFSVKTLPFESQLFPVMAIHSMDLNSDGNKDLILAGNIYDVKPSMGGRQDAGYGLVLLGDGDGNFRSIPHSESGFFIEGEVRSIRSIGINNNTDYLIIARNDDSPLIFRH